MAIPKRVKIIPTAQSIAEGDHLFGEQGDVRKAFPFSVIAGALGTFNVVSYGAAGDGATNDVAAIQAAIDAASAAGGGVVFLPEGTYAVESEIALASNVWLEGASWKSLIKRTAVTIDNLLHGVQVDNIQLRNFSIDGQRSIQTKHTSDSDHNNIRFTDCNNVVVENIESYNSVYHGVFITADTSPQDDSSVVAVRDCYLHDNGFRACHIHGTDDNALDDVIVIGNVCVDNGADPTSGDDTGIYVPLTNINSAVVSNNIIHGDGGFGLVLDGTGIETTTTKNTVCQGNIVHDVNIGLLITGGATNVIVQGCVIQNCTLHGIDIRNSVKGLAIQGCLIEGCGSRGIIMQASSPENEDIVVQGNTIRNNGNRGIEYRDVIGGVIAGNMLNDNGTATTGANAIIVRGANTTNVNVTGNTMTSSSKSFTGSTSLEISEVTQVMAVGNICLSRDSGNQIIVQASATDVYLSSNIGTLLDLGTGTKEINYP